MNRNDKKRIESKLQNAISSPQLNRKYAKAVEDVEEEGGKKRNQFNFQLSETDEGRLDAICNLWETTRSATLRRLIQEKYFAMSQAVVGKGSARG